MSLFVQITLFIMCLFYLLVNWPYKWVFSLCCRSSWITGADDSQGNGCR